eukprot:303503_1
MAAKEPSVSHGSSEALYDKGNKYQSRVEMHQPQRNKSQKNKSHVPMSSSYEYPTIEAYQQQYQKSSTRCCDIIVAIIVTMIAMITLINSASLVYLFVFSNGNGQCSCNTSGLNVDSVAPTAAPSYSPNQSPTYFTSSVNPTTTPSFKPTTIPSLIATMQSSIPTIIPSLIPTAIPSPIPTLSPTIFPTSQPSLSPTTIPTFSPTYQPTRLPTLSPTIFPTKTPTESPSPRPTRSPTSQPTRLPTHSPTIFPSKIPSELPSTRPTPPPTSQPTRSPTLSPTIFPTKTPTPSPTPSPTNLPIRSPSLQPTPSPIGPDYMSGWVSLNGNTYAARSMETFSLPSEPSFWIVEWRIDSSGFTFPIPSQNYYTDTNNAQTWGYVSYWDSSSSAIKWIAGILNVCYWDGSALKKPSATNVGIGQIRVKVWWN